MQLHRLGNAFGEITGHALMKWRSRFGEMTGHDAVKYPLDVNLRLWKVEDDIRDKELLKEFDITFVELAHSANRVNDQLVDVLIEINQRCRE